MSSVGGWRWDDGEPKFQSASTKLRGEFPISETAKHSSDPVPLQLHLFRSILSYFYAAYVDYLMFLCLNVGYFMYRCNIIRRVSHSVKRTSRCRLIAVLRVASNLSRLPGLPTNLEVTVLVELTRFFR